MEIKGKTIEGEFHRECRLLRQAINEDSRSVELAFSSEDEYERWFGKEVLGHQSKEVRMKRLKDGTHPFLLQHDTDKQIGVIDKAWIDEEGKKGRAVVRFAPATNKLAEEVWQDVLAGIRSQISVGYRVHKFKEKIPLNEEGEPDPDKAVYRAVDWEPFEISQVAIAADPTVGIGKSHKGAEPTNNKPEDKETEQAKETETTPEPVAPQILVRKESMEKEKTLTEKDRERIALEEKQAREKAEAEAKQHNEKLGKRKRH
jgi:phage head maturation protease